MKQRDKRRQRNGAKRRYKENQIHGNQPYTTCKRLTGAEWGIDRDSQKFENLGFLITDNLDPSVEIKNRIEIAGSTFCAMKPSNGLNMFLRQRLIKCYVWSILMYGVEFWTLRNNTLNILDAFEMWILRWILKILGTARIAKNKVLRRAWTEYELIIVVRTY